MTAFSEDFRPDQAFQRECTGAIEVPSRRHAPSLPSPLFDGGRSAPFCRRELAALYGFTRAEAEAAIAIARGRDPESFAVESNRSVQTVRGLLKRAMSKAGVCRQNALAALLWSSAAGPFSGLFNHGRESGRACGRVCEDCGTRGCSSPG